MSTKTLSFILVFFSISFAYAQEPLWLKQTKISDIIAFEKGIDPSVELKTANVSLGKDYYPLSDKYQVTRPISIQRKALKYLPLYAEYFFTPGDSVLRLASYDWEKDKYGNFFAKQKMWQEESTKISTYNAEYERIKKDLLTKLGTPNKADDAPKEVSYDGSKYLSRKTLWDNDVYNAELSLIFASGTYRIRLTIYWKK